MLYDKLRYTYIEEITANETWDLQQPNHIHALGVKLVIYTLDDYYQHFSQGLDMFDSRVTYGVAFEKNAHQKHHPMNKIPFEVGQVTHS